MLNHQPDELNLLRKLQESTTSDIDEDKGIFQKGDRVLYKMFESGLSESDLVRMLGSDEYAMRSNHNESIATIAEAIGEEVSRYSIIFEDGYIVNDVTPSELLPVKKEEEAVNERSLYGVTEDEDLADKAVKMLSDSGLDSVYGNRVQGQYEVHFESDEQQLVTDAISDLRNLGLKVVNPSGRKVAESESKIDEDLTAAEVKKLFTSIDPAFAKHLTSMSRSKKNIVQRGKDVGLTPSAAGLEALREKAKDVPEKPKIEAEEVGMEDMSEEDLEKAKSKSAESGNAITQVEDKEIENDKMPKPSKEQNVSEGIQDISDEQLRTLANNTRKSYNYWKNVKSQPERASSVKAQLDAYEKELDRRRNESVNESKFPFMRTQKPLWLCNECFTTFRSNESACTKCGNSDLIEKLSEAKDSDLAAGETKEVFKVTWKNKETGKEETTNVMAFDKTAAEKEAKRPSREDVKAEGPIMSEPKDEGKDNPGVRDGTGPAKYSAQRSISNKGRRKEAGEECPFESKLKEETGDKRYDVKMRVLVADGYTFTDENIDEQIRRGMDKAFIIEFITSNPVNESKIKEGVQELIGEVPGIEKDEQEALRKAIEDGTISNEWPSDEKMVDALEKAGVDSAIANAEDLEDFRIAYLKHVLLTLAMKPHLAAKESDISEEEAELYVGAPVKILRGRSRGQIGEIVDIQIADEDPNGQGQIDVKLEDGRVIYLEWEDVVMIDNNPEVNTKEQEPLGEAFDDWDVTFKYKHNIIQHNPLENRNNEAVLPRNISGKKVRVFSDYQADWVERNKGVAVRETIIKEDNISKSAAQLKKDTESSIIVEIAVSGIDSDVYNLSIVELPSGNKVIIDTDADKEQLTIRGKALAHQLGAQFAGVVSEEGGHDAIDGGLADKNQPEDFDPEQLEKGIKVEMEHTDDPTIAREIAMDHLHEHPDYYTALAKMEDELEKEEETAPSDLEESEREVNVEASGLVNFGKDVYKIDDKGKEILNSILSRPSRLSVQYGLNKVARSGDSAGGLSVGHEDNNVVFYTQGRKPSATFTEEEFKEKFSVLLETVNEEQVDAETQNEVVALYKKFRAQSRSREEAVQATVKAMKIPVDAPMIRNLLMKKGVREQEEDTFTTIGQALAEEDAKKLADEKDGQVVPDDENKDKFAVIVKDKV